jgi:hypothetical protein
MARASLLIATRNREPQLRISLPTIQARNYRDLDVVVIDDGSTDGTKHLLRQWPGIRVLSMDRIGGYRKNPSPVWNLGHRSVETDVVIEQGGEVAHLTNCIDPLLETCRPGIVSLARVYHGEVEDLRRVDRHFSDPGAAWPADVLVEGKGMRTNAGTWPAARVTPGVDLFCGSERPVPFMFLGAIHREDFEAVGGYDESRPDRNDEDLANRLIARGVNFFFSGRAIAFHLRHGKS